MLCKVCKGIDFRPLSEWNRPDSEVENKNNAAYGRGFSSPSDVAKWKTGTGNLYTYYFHHVSPTALRNSAIESCYLCAIIYFGLFSTNIELQSEDLILPPVPTVHQPVILTMFLEVGCMVWQDTSKGKFINVFCGPYQCRLDGLDASTESQISDDQYLKRLGQLPDLWADGLMNGSTSTWSHLNQNLAKSWLSNCQDNHAACRPSNPSAELPRRVIDLGPPKETPQPILIEPTARTPGQYVTLSYCWGNLKPMSVKLTQKTGCWSLPILSDWPVVYQEAIVVTKALGFRYLWIDAVCIMQNDRADWEVESGKMAQYYQKSSLTIAAATSAGSQNGTLFKYRNPLMTYPHQLVLNNNGPNARPYRQLVLAPKANGYLADRDERDPRISPLYARAWVLQEQILSPRLLTFGHRRLYWQCCTQSESESILLDEACAPATSSPLLLRMAEPQHIFSRIPGRNAYYDAWYDTLSVFNTRNITYQDDILPSLSGIAEVLRPFLKADDEYLAGLWYGDWRVGLLWCRIGYDPLRARVETTRPNFKPPVLGAPSWSWVNTAHEQLSYKFDTKILPPHGVLLTRKSVTRLLSRKIVPHNAASPYGAVVSGRLEFTSKCPTITIALECTPVITPDQSVRTLEMLNSSDDVQYHHVYVEDECFPHYVRAWMSPHWPEIQGDCILDDVAACEKMLRLDSSWTVDGPSKTITARFLPLLDYRVEHTSTELSNRTMGLALIPIKGHDGSIEYKRIGRACINIMAFGWDWCTLPEERICIV